MTRISALNKPSPRGAVTRAALQQRLKLLRTLFGAAAFSLVGFGMAASSLVPHVAKAAIGSDTPEELDRVDVYGTPAAVWTLRQAVIEAEDRFFSRYNELNRNDDFDVNCRVEARTGTRLNTRTCRPLYQEVAVQEGAKQAVELRQKFQSEGGRALLGSNSPPVPAAIAIMARRPEFERNMRSVVQSHPELLALLEERATAAQALEKATRRAGKSEDGARQVELPAGRSGE